MTEKQKTLAEIRDELADQNWKQYDEVMRRGQHYGSDELGDLQRDCEDIFKLGFDAGVAEMKKRAEVLVKTIDALYMLEKHKGHLDMAGELKLSLEEYRKSLGEGE